MRIILCRVFLHNAESSWSINKLVSILTPSLLLAGYARQSLFSVILPRSIYVCLSADFCRCKRLQRLSNSQPSVRPDCGCIVMSFQAHCFGVINMSPRDNLSPAARIYRRHRRMRRNNASHKHYQLAGGSRVVPGGHAPKTSDNFFVLRKTDFMKMWPTPKVLPMQNNFQLQGRLCPTGPLTRAFAPGLCWGSACPTPVIGWRSALTIVSPKLWPASVYQLL